jgi:hypothetical protein
MNFPQLIQNFLVSENWLQARTIAQTIQALVLSSVPFGAGYWFFKKRKFYPRANLKHQVIHKFLDDDQLLIRVVVEIMNPGDVSIRLENAEIRVQWILPLVSDVRDQINHAIKNSKKDILWPVIGSNKVLTQRTIESNESDYEYFDIMVTGDYTSVKTILVTSIFDKNIKSKDQVWRLSTFYDLVENE